MKTIKEILSMPEASDVHKYLTARKQGFRTPLTILEEQWNPVSHRVMDKEFRKNKIINVPTGQTNPITGKPEYKKKEVNVVRIAIPIQKSIVNLTVGFLLMNAVTYKATAHGVDVKKMRQEIGKKRQL